MERLTIRKTDIVLFQKDGQYTPPISMNGEQVRKTLERLAELEDAIEQGKLVEVVRCVECEAAEGCSGYEGAEDSFLMQRFMRLE